MLTIEDYQLMDKVVKENSTVEYIVSRFAEEEKAVAMKTVQELRNVLSCLNTSLQLIQEYHPEVEYFTHWSEMQLDMRMLCNRLKEYERIYESMDAIKRKGNLLELVQNTVKDYQERFRLIGVVLELTMDELSERLAQKCVFDETHIQRVLNKLLCAVLKESKVGETIRVSITTEKAQGSVENSIHVRVNYGGDVISQEDITRLFEPYYSIGEEEETTGLSYVKNTLLAHRGDVVARKNKKEAYIEFYLPIIA